MVFLWLTATRNLAPHFRCPKSPIQTLACKFTIGLFFITLSTRPFAMLRNQHPWLFILTMCFSLPVITGAQDSNSFRDKVRTSKNLLVGFQQTARQPQPGDDRQEVRREGQIECWSNFFNSLRASAETDLMDSHGFRLACRWAGNNYRRCGNQTSMTPVALAIRARIRGHKLTPDPTLH